VIAYAFVEETSIQTDQPLPRASQLRRLLGPEDETPFDSAEGNGPVSWLTAGAWRVYARPRLTGAPVGEEIERFALPTGESVAAVMANGHDRAWVPFDLDEAYRNYVSESWRRGSDSRSLSKSQLRAYYFAKRLIPRRVQLAARRVYTRWVGYPEFPAWPLDDSVALLLRFYARLLLGAETDTMRFRWFWPGKFRAAALLTHDVETAEGLRLALELADLEEERGFRSSFNVVAAWYPVDQGILRELRERGFEIGLHGLRHDHSLFNSYSAFHGQLPAIRRAARAFEATGFRSPSTHRVHDWLAELPLSYDCSVPHSDPFEPMPGGCCTLWPYFIGEVVELPYTLPQDHTLFTVLQKRSAATWISLVEAIESRYGLIQCLSHPDPGYLGDPEHRGFYLELLDALAERPQLWKPLPRELVAWWRQRDAGAPGDNLSYGTIRRQAGSPFAALEPPKQGGGA
jgi:peptidoglycan/xylan/chitin deacetylase (PgdA/CDA1 family)